MNFDRILFHIEHSSTLRLLQSKQAPLALSFFFFAFKLKNRLQLPYSELKELLAQFLENLDNTLNRKNSLPMALIQVRNELTQIFSLGRAQGADSSGWRLSPPCLFSKIES